MSTASPVPDFVRLFRADPYRFEFGAHSSDFPWFTLASGPDMALARRAGLLAAHPDRHLPWTPAAAAVLDGLLDWFDDDRVRPLRGRGREGLARLAGLWEPDVVLLRRDPAGEFRMIGGCVCDPSSWDPAAKLGLRVAEIHAPVPGLNEQLGGRIQGFLDRLPEDTVICRENWGLAAVPDRNLHPEVPRGRLGPNTSPDSAWLRVEHQAFRALPGVQGLVFVIWLTVHPLQEVLETPGVAPLFRRHLETMPPAVAEYKGLAAARETLLRRL
ncbi:MAG: DUF3445 domain-containing protein [Verrucomicrobia bacterium]|nr:DUF3445 domain-containing protein [Verrucomicrobiota bacterium]